MPTMWGCGWAFLHAAPDPVRQPRDYRRSTKPGKRKKRR